MAKHRHVKLSAYIAMSAIIWMAVKAMAIYPAPPCIDISDCTTDPSCKVDGGESACYYATSSCVWTSKQIATSAASAKNGETIRHTITKPVKTDALAKTQMHCRAILIKHAHGIKTTAFAVAGAQMIIKLLRNALRMQHVPGPQQSNSLGVVS